MEQNSGEADSRSESDKTARLLWNPMVHHRVHNSPPLVPILSQMNPVHALTYYLLEIHFNIISDIALVLPSAVFPSGFNFSSTLCELHVASHNS
jgi:hypothetical protein